MIRRTALEISLDLIIKRRLHNLADTAPDLDLLVQETIACLSYVALVEHIGPAYAAPAIDYSKFGPNVVNFKRRTA